jgi:hypothetical protein
MTSSASDDFIDPALSSQLVSSLLSLMQSASSPDALEAQNIILRRLALEGDVVGSRIPPPRNISEVGCYINLLTTLNQPEMRAQALAGALGVAGPNPPLGWISNTQPLVFLTLINDRPVGPAQPTIPLTVSIRSDFAAPLQAALSSLHTQGAMLPLQAQPTWLPVSTPSAQPPADPLPYIGRALDLVGGAALVDPSSDALALTATNSSGSSWQIGSLIPGSPAAANVWAWKCDAVSCVVQPATASYVPVTPLLANAGFYPTSSLVPTSLAFTGWAHFTNITGLISGVTRLGDELSLLYNWNAITNSVFAGILTWVWNGTQFAP